MSELPANKSTLILMADSRSPLSGSRLLAPYYSLAAAINLNYAQKHGYAFTYYQFAPLDSVESNPTKTTRGRTLTGWQSVIERSRWWADVTAYSLLRQLAPLSASRPKLQSSLGRNYARLRKLLGRLSEEDPWLGRNKRTMYCRHPDHGERAAPWGKLIAIQSGFTAGYQTVIYIDSDAIFLEPEKSIPSFLKESRSTSANVNSADLTVLHSVPFMQEEANSGFMVWRNTPSTRHLLAQWWHTNAGRFHQHHDYEQSVLKRTLLVNPATRKRIAIVPEDCFLERKNQFIRHVSSPHAVQRVPRFRSAAARAGITETRYKRLMQDMESQHLLLLNCDTAEFAPSGNINAEKAK